MENFGSRPKTSLVHEHEVIRAQFRLLILSLGDLAHQLAAAPNQSGGPLDEIQGYCWKMHDLQDGLNEHIELDERIVMQLQLGSPADRLLEEHVTIRRRVDQAVQLAESAKSNVRDQKTLDNFRFELSRELATIRELIEKHTDAEDRLFRSG